jgi:hypothetical protein
MARAFDSGSSQYLGNTNAPISAYGMSVACWFYITDSTANRILFTQTDADTDGHYFSLRAGLAGNDNISAVIDAGGAQGVANTTTSFNDNTWHHAGASFTSDILRTAYLDGSGKGTDATDVGAFPGGGQDRMSIGLNWRLNPVGYFDGYIAELGLWDAVLSDAEFAVLAKGYSPLFVRPQSLVAYWPLIGKLSPELDYVGGYDMTLTNGPTTGAHPPIFKIPAPWSSDYQITPIRRRCFRGYSIQTTNA